MVVHTPFLRRMDPVVSWRLYQYALPLESVAKLLCPEKSMILRPFASGSVAATVYATRPTPCGLGEENRCKGPRKGDFSGRMSFATDSLNAFYEMREGFILKVTFQDGSLGWGEIAPLPGRNKESLSEAKEQLLQALRGTLHSPPCPSVAFGLESALVPYTPPKKRFPLWALLGGTVEAIQEKAKRAEQEGFRAIKIKVSDLSQKEAESVITPLIGKFQLRIDVNRAWTFDEALSFFSQFPESAISSIEEPTHELDQLHRFPFPFALDESLSEISLSQLSRFPHLTTLIVKPTVSGGTYALKILEQLGKKIIFTGAFESGIGTAQIAMLTHQLQLTDAPLGLDTYRFLKQDLLNTPLDFSQGSLELPSQLELNLKHLTEIAHG